MIDDEERQMLNVAVGRAIYLARKAIAITQVDAASWIGMLRTSLINIEQGRQGVSVYQLLVIAEALGTTPAAIIEQALEIREAVQRKKVV